MNDCEYGKITQRRFKYFQREYREVWKMRKFIYEMKVEFYKEIVILKERWTKMMTEMKNKIGQIKDSVKYLTNRIQHVKDWVSEYDGK